MEQRPVYLVCGEEEFLRQERLNELLRRHAPSVNRDLNISIFDASPGDLSAQNILDCLNTLPFGSEKRIALVKSCHELAEQDQDAVIAYCRRPNPTSILILESPKEPSESAFLESVAGSAQVLLCSRLSKEKLNGWITERFRAYGKTIAYDAVELLKERVGADLLLYAAEIEKLVNFTGTRTGVTVRDVEEIVGTSLEKSIYALSDAIADKRPAAALESLRELVAHSHPLPEIIGKLAWQLVRLRKAKAAYASGGDKGQIHKVINIHPYYLDRFVRQLANFTEEELEGDLRLLLETDIKTKSSGTQPLLVVEQAVLEMTKKGR